jgi:hypothetical protein
MCIDTMDRPSGFNMQDFTDFLVEHLPTEYADYVLGLCNLAEEQCKCNQAWAKLLEDNNE